MVFVWLSTSVDAFGSFGQPFPLRDVSCVCWQAGNIIRSNGLTTNRYNELSHILGKSKDLRERVQHQAYLHRVNADVVQPLVDLVQDKSQKVVVQTTFDVCVCVCLLNCT